MEGKSFVRTRIEARCSNLMMGIAVNLDWCRASKFTQLLDILEFQGWSDLFGVCYNNVMSYTIMNKFTETFKHENGIITTKIGTRKIEFGAGDLSEAFGIPNEGFRDYFKG